MGSPSAHTSRQITRLLRMGALAAGLLIVAARPGDAQAITRPVAGAVAKPSKLALRAPFPCGTAYTIWNAYGATDLHSGTSNSGSSNDYYAIDMVRSTGDLGEGKPITAVAPGVVKFSAWTTPHWDSYGLVVLVEHDIGDGSRYMSLYAHLKTLSVQVGQRVAAGDQVGTMGGSAYRQQGYWKTHLHFAMYRNANIGGGPYGGNAMVPEPLGGAENIAKGLQLTAECDAAPPTTTTTTQQQPTRPSTGSGTQEPDPGPLSLPSLPDRGLSADGGASEFVTEGEPGAWATGEYSGSPPAVYGGCAVVPGASCGGWLWLALALALLRRRRR